MTNENEKWFLNQLSLLQTLFFGRRYFWEWYITTYKIALTAAKQGESLQSFVYTMLLSKNAFGSRKRHSPPNTQFLNIN